MLKLVITTGVDVADVTHLGRGPTAAQRAALLWANPTCSVHGCQRPGRRHMQTPLRPTRPPHHPRYRNGVPPAFRTVDPIGSISERRGIDAYEVSEVFAGVS
jgi:hypothetical protein